ncbi:MAG: GumC family protein [Pseudomonadota bacterium]
MSEQRPESRQRNNDEFEIDLHQIVALLRRYTLPVLGVALAVALLAAVIAFSMTPVYRATATLLIEDQSAKIVSIEEVYGVGGQDKQYLDTQMEMLRSRSLAEHVVRDLDLVEHPLYQSEPGLLSRFKGWFVEPIPPTEEERFDEVVRSVLEHLSVGAAGKTQMVNVSFASENATLARRIANAFARGYIDMQLEAKAGMATRAVDMLSKRLVDMEEKMQEAERALQDYRERENLVDVSGVTTLTTKEINKLSELIVEQRSQMAELQGVYNQVKSAEGDLSVNELEQVSVVMAHPLTQSFKQKSAEAESKVLELAERYGPRHPEMLAAQADYKVAQRKYAEQLRSVAEGLKQEYEAALNKERELVRAFERAKDELQAIRTKEFELRQLEREASTNRQLYDAFFKRLKEASETMDLSTANARVIDTAQTPNRAYKPRKALIILMAFVLAVLGGFGVAQLLEILDNTFKSPRDVEDKLNLPVLAIVPKQKGDEAFQLYRGFVDGKHRAFAESIRSLRTSFMLSSGGRERKVVVVTSSVPGEGKTTISSNLAFAMGQSEKVLLVDADMRRATMDRNFGVQPGAPGLANVLNGNAELEDCLHRENGIDILPAGTVPPDPQELLARPACQALMSQLRERYDRIVIDSPPAQAVSDAKILSDLADAVIYVLKADATATHVVEYCVGDLLQSGAPLAGVAMNQVSLSRTSREGYTYGAYYGDSDAHYDNRETESRRD